MTPDYDLFKMMHGKTVDDVGNEVPSAENWVHRTISELHSNFPLRLLGVSRNGNQYVSEEERYVNFHVIGAPGEGKSKFLEYQIREDIQKGIGLCLIDSSDFGATYLEVLKYCAKVKHKKVCIIDPYTLATHGKLATIKPLNPKYVKQSVEGLMDLTGILFGAKETETPRLRKYLSAVFKILARENLTLVESQYLGEYQDPKSLKFLGWDRDSRSIRSVFKSEYAWMNYFESTISRLNVFWDEPLSEMLGADTGIDFVEMLRDGWVVLCNLAPGRGLNSTEGKLLGVLIINQYIQAVDILKRRGWSGRYYFYIDEAGRFATPQFSDLLQQRRKSGLGLILAHQSLSQFESKKILDAVRGDTGIKVMFNLREPEDRTAMMRSLGYGGEITPTMAAFANQDLPKQYAILKKNKEAPVRIRIPDVKPVDLEPDEYIKQVLDAPWYLTKDQIKKQINVRKLRAYSPSIRRGKTSNNPPASTSTVSKRTAQEDVGKGVRESEVPEKKWPFKI
jgi:hypothetical protein